ncbi:hypothetical protein IWQ56_005755, partial [Coemansia nantahalensis]
PLGPQTTLWSMQSEHADAMLDMPRPPPQVASTSAGSTPRFGEYGPAPGGSGVTSLSWVPGSETALFVASKRTRWSIRWFDLREASKSGTVLYVPMLGAGGGAGSSGTVYDLQFDPFNSVRYMAHDRCGTVNVWDVRWATKPAYTLNTGQRSVLSMQYSPRCSGMVASLAADSGVFDVFSIGEFFNGRAVQSERLSPSAILDNAWVKGQYSDDRMASLSAPPPAQLQFCTDRASTAPRPSGLAEPHMAFLWMTPAATARTRCSRQLVSCGSSGALYATGLPGPRVGVANCHGDLAIANNWSRLLGALPATPQEMDMLHVAVPEMSEIALDQNRMSHSARVAMGGAKGGGGGGGGGLSAPAVSAQLSASASLLSMHHTGQPPSAAGGGVLGRRHHAARGGSLAGGEPWIAQLRERVRGLNLGPGEGQAAADSGCSKWLSPQRCEQLLAGSISYSPSGDEACTDAGGARGALAGDVIVQMRRRALQGYGTNAD